MTVDEEGVAWDGTERRSSSALHPETAEALTAVQEAILANAKSMDRVASAIADAILQQQRSQRRWLAFLTVAVFVIGGVVVWGRVEGVKTGNNVTAALDVSRENNDHVAFLVACLQDEDSFCYEAIEAKERAVRDADRKLMAEEIICYTTGSCPPGMDRNNIPDLRDLPDPEAVE